MSDGFVVRTKWRWPNFWCFQISIKDSQDALFWLFSDKRGIDGRLASAQTALMLQEETIRRNERDRKSMSDKILTLERTVAASETEKRQLHVSVVVLHVFGWGGVGAC